MRRYVHYLGCLLLSVTISQLSYSQSKKELKLHKNALENLAEWQNPFSQWNFLGDIKIDSFSIDRKKKIIEFHFSTPLSYIPVRENSYDQAISSLKESVGENFKKYDIRIITDGQPLEALIPNYYRKSLELDAGRMDLPEEARIPIVRQAEREIPVKGLYNRNIALWHSHGWYYEAKLDRWEWQRARLYSTVEDIFPLTFVLPYLTPMLENAGAHVFLPRERDTQPQEIIVDNDLSSNDSEITFQGINPKAVFTDGFMQQDTLFNNENPFQLGSHLRFKSSAREDQFMDYVPDFIEGGDYAVYISFVQDDDNIADAHYTITHSGGQTAFLVNQKIGGGTWIYLGTFHFKKGKNVNMGSVRLSAKSEETGWISADAVRFGGGMGNIARKPADELWPNKWSLKEGEAEDSVLKSNPEQYQWKSSGRARYLEGARYYLQYAGFPDTLVYSLNEGKNDYNDDYQSRGEWVNYLKDSPGPDGNRNAPGLNIPIDLSLAFHTDAGVTPKDSIIGTLTIYDAVRDNGTFPNGQSKLANRDLSDMIQSEIIHDIRLQFAPDWTRRAMWNKQYSEAWRPKVPSMLLELLSHQNLSDMQFGLDPRFKFAVSRAVYKGITKFITFQHHVEYVIQPLPVDHFSIQKMDKKTIKLSWRPVLDSLEPSASPQKYMVYKRIGDNGFDNGQLVDGTALILELEVFDQVVSFKVTAWNEGGESFPSEILSVGLLEYDASPVLVVNGFDRVSAPVCIDQGDFAGLAYWEDEGVADKVNIGYTGMQYDFDRNSPWLDDDSPGWGASYGDMEGKMIPGNSFDNVYVHGTSILHAGHSFVSTSDEAFSDVNFDLNPYQAIDLLFGEEKTTASSHGNLFEVFDASMRQKITDFTDRGGNVFASGAYIASDFIINKDSAARSFAQNVLHFQWRSNHAVKLGNVYSTDYASDVFGGAWNFNTIYHPAIYKVEAPDAIEPFGEGAISAFRYGENNTSAGIAFQGSYRTVVLGFPFETIMDETGRNDLMNQILHYFYK